MHTIGSLLTSAALITVCGLTPAGALEPHLVKDINEISVGDSSFPDSFVALGGVVVFRAMDRDYGRELWRSDGKPGGTYRLTDLCPGECSGEIFEPLLRIGQRALFSAFAENRWQLWATDGTVAGTALLRDSLQMKLAGDQRRYVAVGDRLFFVAEGDEHREQVWITNGTSAGTRRVSRLAPAHEPVELTAVGGRVFFFSRPHLFSATLWVTNGTEVGTRQVGGPWDNNVFGMEAVGNRVVFVAPGPGRGSELWQSDGTAERTSLVADLSPGGASTKVFSRRVIGTRYFFVALRENRSEGQELWVTDGTSKGTRQLTNLRQFDAFFSVDRDLFLTGPTLGARLVFRADDGSHGVEPWISDGTPKGTRLLKDFCPGVCSGGGEALLALRDRLLLRGKDHRGMELWTTNGTEKGTAILKDLCPGSCDAGLGAIGVLGTTALFAASKDRVGTQLWATDGTAGGTRQLTDLEDGAQIYPGTLDTNGGAAGKVLFFVGSLRSFGTEPWRTDGTAQGTFLVRDIAAGDTSGSFPSSLRAAGNLVFFVASGDGNRYQLWRSDGTESGTVVLTDQLPNGEFRPSLSLRTASRAGSLYFQSFKGGGPYGALWKSDGTVAGTAPLVPGGFFDPLRVSLAATSSLVFFQGFDPVHGSGLWKTDGTVAGTGALVASAGHAPDQITPAGQRVFFTVQNDEGGEELWSSDGTEASTRLVTDQVGDPTESALTALTALGEKLLLVEDLSGEIWISDGTPAGTLLLAEVGWHGAGLRSPIVPLGSRALIFTGLELWITDGTPAGTAYVTDVEASFAGARAVVYQGFVYFPVNAGTETELWRSDGTAAGTTRVLDSEGHAIAEPQALVEFAGKLVFIAANGLDMALWTSDGSPAGTAPLLRVQLGHFNQEFPWELVQAGDRLFFRAQDGTTGWELWALRP